MEALPAVPSFATGALLPHPLPTFSCIFGPTFPDAASHATSSLEEHRGRARVPFYCFLCFWLFAACCPPSFLLWPAYPGAAHWNWVLHGGTSFFTPLYPALSRFPEDNLVLLAVVSTEGLEQVFHGLGKRVIEEPRSPRYLNVLLPEDGQK